MRAGSSLGVILHGKDGIGGRANAFHGPVVEIDMGDLHVGGEGFPISGKAVVLRGDGNPSAAEILDWLVSTAMPEFQFEGLPAKGVGKDLMAETNAEDRFFPNEFPDLGMDIVECFRVTGSVGQEDSIRIKFEDLAGGGASTHHLDFKTVLTELPQDVVFHSEVIGDDAAKRFRKWVVVVFLPMGGLGDSPPAGLFFPSEGLGGGDFLDKV